ncbi:MAG TPA: prolipoprotein diacylglyceryl transferase [Opitutaceae bacterium]|nr:prolipoprotein diacylglyceryl transferase [Opitutaceae bacterium]
MLTPFPLFLAHRVHDFSPFLGPHWGNIGIRYYGLAYLLGFLVSAWLLKLYARAERSEIPASKISDLMVFVVLGVFLGGRLGYFLLYQAPNFRADPFAVLRVWEGGMASHGGMLGVAVALWWYSRSEKIPLLHLSDLIVSTAPAGLFFGRVANFINGELWGKHSQVSWAFIFENTHGGPLPRHPSQLYEAALEGLILFAFMQWRVWGTDVVRQKPGRLTGEFFIAYAALRAVGEIFREPDAGLSLFFGLSRGTFYSIFLVIAGLLLVLRKQR